MSSASSHPTAPDLQVSKWLNSDSPITLAELRGKVVVIEVFQMLCPGCVSHGLPQATAIAEYFSAEQVTVLGLHSVFEHHGAMQPHALEAFLYEYRIRFPVAVDTPAEPGTGPIPKTMQAYGLRGTPSLIVIDRAGQLRSNHFGRVSDMQIGAEVSSLMHEPSSRADSTATPVVAEGGPNCTGEGCAI